MIERLRQDLRYAARQLWRVPLFTVVACLSLAIGITVAVAVFSVLNSILFKPLPVAEPEAIVHLYVSHRGLEYRGSSYGDLDDYQRSGVFTATAAHAQRWATVAANQRAPSRADVVFVSPNFFQVLGLRLVLGRPFNAEGNAPEIVISEHYWRRTFHSDPNVLGGIVRVNNWSLTVVGVAPAAFRGLSPGPSVVGWIPAQQMPHAFARNTALTDRSRRSFGMVGRLAPGLTIPAATARLVNTARRLSEVAPQSWRDETGAPLRITVLSHKQSIVKPDNDAMRSALAAVAALVLAVLLLACTNVAGLLLGRAITRRHEVAVRLTLGASRGRLVSQLLTEALLLAAIGGASGFVCAQWTIQWAARYPVFDSVDLAPDWRVLLTTGLITLFSAVMFGLTPALQALRVDVRSRLSGHTIIGDDRRARGGLIALQVCVSCLLIMIAFSAGRGVRSQLDTDPRLELDGLMAAELDLLDFGPDSVQRAQYIDNAANLLRSITGVERMTVTPTLPLSSLEGSDARLAFVDGRTVSVRYTTVDHEYFETLGVRLLSGRAVNSGDIRSAARVAVVNRAFIEAHGRAVIGQSVTLDGHSRLLVVGVVDDGKGRALSRGGRPLIYEAIRHSWNSTNRAYLIARVGPNQRGIAAAFTRSLRDRYPNHLPPAVEPLGSFLERIIEPQRFIANIALGVGVTELALATIGLYSLLLFGLLARSREIGLRMALGATAGHASLLVIRQGLRYVAVGSIVGLILCIPAARFGANTFIGAKASDPLPFMFVLLTIALSSTAAAYIPARRAARIEPMTALRRD